MRLSRLASLLALSAAALMPPSVSAQPAQPGVESLTARLNGLLRANEPLQAFVTRAHGLFFATDVTLDDKISAADIDEEKVRTGTMLRSNAVSTLLRADRDGDGVVTRDELTRFFSQAAASVMRGNPAAAQFREKLLEDQVNTQMRADTNGDGRIDYPEMLAFGASKQTGSAPLMERTVGMFLLADANSDGATDLAEFDRAVEAHFRLADADGDSTLTTAELNAYRGRATNGVTTPPPSPQSELARRREEERQAQEVAQRAACAMPRASDGAKIIQLSAYEPDSVSTTTIGSQDVSVGTATLTVEDGSEPLYVVISTNRATIWRVSGAVNRLERLVLSSDRTRANGGDPKEIPLAGATGLPAEKITFLQRAGCLRSFNEAPSIASATASSAVAREAGRAPDAQFARYQVGGFSVPSGAISAADRNARRPNVIIVQKNEGTLTIEGDPRNFAVQIGNDLEREMRRFDPGGIVEIKPEDVVASQPAERYVVLPQQAGLLQLVQSGALKQNNSREFLITQKIRMPAELFGAQSAKFLLLRGVPVPDGNFGHSTVVSEETGLPIKQPPQ